MANLKEVAELAGVSIATASLVLRGGGNIRESTRIRVMTCAKRLNYTPNQIGRTLNTGQKSMQQAANYLSRAEGWDSWTRGRVWRNFCPGCIEGGDPDSDLDQVGLGLGRKPGVDDDYS